MYKAVRVKPYSKKELAIFYEMSPRSFYTLFKPHEEFVGTKPGRYFSARQVEIIFERLGTPSLFLSDEFSPSPKGQPYFKLFKSAA